MPAIFLTMAITCGFPAMAEYQASLAPRIMALSATRDCDLLPTDARAAVNTRITADTATVWAQKRLLADACLMTVGRGNIAA